MPLKSSKKPAVFKENVREMMNSESFGKDKPKGKKLQMALAAAYAKKRQSRG